MGKGWHFGCEKLLFGSVSVDFGVISGQVGFDALHRWQCNFRETIGERVNRWKGRFTDLLIVAAPRIGAIPQKVCPRRSRQEILQSRNGILSYLAIIRPLFPAGFRLLGQAHGGVV